MVTYLPAPAEADAGPLCDVGVVFLQLRDERREFRAGLGRRGGGLEELAELRLVLVRLRRVPRGVGGGALEEIGHVHAVGTVGVAVGEDVGALERLREVAEDVVDEDDGVGGGRGARDVWRR